jgi:hypothetical protein
MQQRVYVCVRLATEAVRAVQMLNRQYQQPYSEVDGFSTLMRYPTQNCGCCKVSDSVTLSCPR